MLAAETGPARGDDKMLDVARDQVGVGIEAEDEAFSFSAVVEHKAPSVRHMES
jgi:hypothetical protein